MPIYYQPIYGILRLYEDGKSYKNNDQYKSCMIAMHPGGAVISSAVRSRVKLTREDILEIGYFLLSMGATDVFLSRATGKGLAFAKLVTNGAMSGYYRIDPGQFYGVDDVHD